MHDNNEKDSRYADIINLTRKIRGSASNRIEVFTTILTTLDSENIRR